MESSPNNYFTQIWKYWKLLNTHLFLNPFCASVHNETFYYVMGMATFLEKLITPYSIQWEGKGGKGERENKKKVFAMFLGWTAI